MGQDLARRDDLSIGGVIDNNELRLVEISNLLHFVGDLKLITSGTGRTFDSSPT